MAGTGVKLLPPPKFDGETDFDKFSKLLRAYMGASNTSYGGLFTDAIARGTNEVDDPHLANLRQAHTEAGYEQGELDQMNHTLYYVLASLPQKSAFTIVDQVENNSGLEAFRRLHERLARTIR